MTEQKKDVGDPSLARNEFEALHSFQALMWEKLRKNSHKGGWGHESPTSLMERLRQEVEELQREIDKPIFTPTMSQQTVEDRIQENARAVAREAADVANFAMMIADVFGGLEYRRTDGG